MGYFSHNNRKYDFFNLKQLISKVHVSSMYHSCLNLIVLSNKNSLLNKLRFFSHNANL